MIISASVFHQTLAAIPIFCSEMSMGFGFGWIAPTLRRQRDESTEFSFDIEQCSWIGSLHEFGAIFGPLLAAFFVDVLGRQKIMIACIFTFFAGWPVIFFTRSLPILYTIRFIFGLAVGLNDVCSAIYVGENFTPKLRGIITSISISFFYGAILLDFILTTYLSYSTAAVVNSVMMTAILFCNFLTTETPQYLIMKKKFIKAEKNFNWLHGLRESDGEFEMLKKFVERESSEKAGFKQLFTNAAYYRPTIIAFTFSVFMMLTGFAALSSFVSMAFNESKWLTSNQFTILFGFCQFMAVCMSPFFIEKFNRKTILIWSFVLIALAHSVTALLYYTISHNFDIPNSSWFVFSTITVYSMVYSFGLHPIFCIVRGELFPQNIKAVGGTIAMIGHSITSFLTAKWFLIVADMYGIYVNFLLFAFFSILAALFTYYWIPETRGKTLAEIQQEARKIPESGSV